MKQKKKTPTWFLGIVIIAMATVFLVQMIFPTNLGKLLSEKAPVPEKISVTITGEPKGSSSYSTASFDEITAFYDWAENQKMRNRSLADSLNAAVKNATQYNFAIETSDGTVTALVIDTEGFVHYGAELYKFVDNHEQVLNNLHKQLDSWQQE